MSTKPISRSLLPKILLVCVLVSGYWVAVSHTNAGLVASFQQLDCSKGGTSIADSTAWSIVSSDLPAAILWQKAEQRPRPNGYVGNPNSGMAVSTGQVAYW